MDAQFWHERWQENRIGFHQTRINLHLERHWPRLDLNGNGRVLVPLCGKSLDMLWLLERGHPVTGVEISPVATAAFLKENRLEATIEEIGSFRAHTLGEFQLFEGDFLELEPHHTGPLVAAWDRASLIALHPDQRPGYARQLARLLPPGAVVLLVSLEYDPGAMTGPPFCVPETEVHELFAGDFEVTPLLREDALGDNPRFREQGLRRMEEVITVLRRRG